MRKLFLIALLAFSLTASSQVRKDTFTVVKYEKQSEWVHVCVLKYKNGLHLNFYAIGQVDLVPKGVKVVVPHGTEGTGVKELYFIYRSKKYVLLPNPSPVQQ